MMQKSPPLRTAGAFLPKRLNRKPGSVLNDDLSRLHVAMQLQPPPGTRRARIVPIWALLLVGFTEPRKLPSALVRSYRTFPPLPAQGRRFLSVALSLGSPPAAVSSYRSLEEPGLSSEGLSGPPPPSVLLASEFSVYHTGLCRVNSCKIFLPSP